MLPRIWKAFALKILGLLTATRELVGNSVPHTARYIVKQFELYYLLVGLSPISRLEHLAIYSNQVITFFSVAFSMPTHRRGLSLVRVVARVTNAFLWHSSLRRRRKPSFGKLSLIRVWSILFIYSRRYRALASSSETEPEDESQDSTTCSAYAYSNASFGTNT